MPRSRARSYSLPFGELMRQTLVIYLANFVPFFVLSAIVLSPWMLCKWLLEHSALFTPATRAEAREMMLESMALGWSMAGLQMVLGTLLSGAIAFGTVQQLRGTPAGVIAGIGLGLRQLGPVLGTGLFAGLRILIGYMLCLVPGIIESCRLYVAIPAAVMEGTGPSTSIERSIRLTMGNRWQLFGVMVFLGLLLWAPVVVVTLWVDRGAGGEVVGSTWFFWVEVALTVTIYSASATAASVAYFMLRSGKDQISVRELAAQFE